MFVIDLGEVIDLVFAIEGTKRMRKNGFKEAKDFIKNMMDEYTISEPGTHVGIVEYSDEPSVKLRLNNMFDEGAIKDIIEVMTPSQGTNANLDRALEKAVDKMFSVSMGGRPSAKKVLVVIAASNTTAKKALKKGGKPLKERGVRIYVVAFDGGKKLPKRPKQLAELIDNDFLKSKWEHSSFLVFYFPSVCLFIRSSLLPLVHQSVSLSVGLSVTCYF